MAAPSTSSCEIADLAAVAAGRDDATSELFFSKGGGGGGGGDLSWPAAAGISSVLSDRKSLVALCDRYGVPREFEPVCAGTLGVRAACETPPQGSNAVCVYSDALEAGLRFPLHGFYLKLLRHYRLAPSQLVPNAWKYMAAFVLRCRYAGVEPLVSAFRYFFSVCTHKRNPGWHHFEPRGGGGRPRLFTGGLPTKFEWRKRFFFLKSPEGMPWKCPVAWGKPRKEDARTVELADAAIDKLKQMPCVDLKDYLSLHDPPVGTLTMLQLHSTPSPIMVKPEPSAAGAQALRFTSLHQLQVTLEAGARAPSTAGPAVEGEGDDPTWRPRRKRRKRRCPCPGSASVTMTPPMPQSCPCPGPTSVAMTPPMPQSFATAMPLRQGMEMTPCGTSIGGAWGNSEISMPPGICSSDDDPLLMYDAMVAIDAEKARLLDKQQATDAKAAQQITHLESQLQQVNAANAKFMDYLVAARAEITQLKEKHASEIAMAKAENTQLKEKYASEVAKFNQEHASEVAKLQEEHHKARTTHAEKVKTERTAEIAKLLEKHAAEVAKLQEEHQKASIAHAEMVKAERTAEIAKLQEKHAEVAKLQEEHQKASTAHSEKVKAECMAEIGKLQEKHAAEVVKLNQEHGSAITLLMEEHAVDIARMEHAAEEMVRDVKKDIALALFPDLDASLL